MNDAPICKRKNCGHHLSDHNKTVADVEGTAVGDFPASSPRSVTNIYAGKAKGESVCSKCYCPEFQGG
jgi:hypothetical protein